MRVIEHRSGSQRSRASALPNLSIMPPHMLWIDRKDATEGQAIDSASKTSVPSRRDSPVPP